MAHSSENSSGPKILDALKKKPDIRTKIGADFQKDTSDLSERTRAGIEELREEALPNLDKSYEILQKLAANYLAKYPGETRIVLPINPDVRRWLADSQVRGAAMTIIYLKRKEDIQAATRETAPMMADSKEKKYQLVIEFQPSEIPGEPPEITDVSVMEVPK